MSQPYLRISTQITEPLRIHMGMDKKTAKKEAVNALREVGIPEPEKRVDMYPHEFSGGMRQRAMIAMALITKPEILIADEPTTALDVTVQKQILELIKSRQRELGTSVIFITHDLAVISEICDEVNVMYVEKSWNEQPPKSSSKPTSRIPALFTIYTSHTTKVKTHTLALPTYERIMMRIGPRRGRDRENA